MEHTAAMLRFSCHKIRLLVSKQYRQFRLHACVIIKVHTRVVLTVWLLDNEFSMSFSVMFLITLCMEVSVV